MFNLRTIPTCLALMGSTLLLSLPAAAQSPAAEILRSLPPIIGDTDAPVSSEMIRGHGLVQQHTIYELDKGSLEIVGRSGRIEDAGMMELRLTDPKDDKAVTEVVTDLLGPAMRERGTKNQIWTMDEFSGGFARDAMLMRTKEKNVRIWRLERRLAQDNPEALALGNKSQAAVPTTQAARRTQQRMPTINRNQTGSSDPQLVD